MTKLEDFEAELEKWWSTEPFGFDHPDTKAGILKLMMWAATESSLIKELEAALENLIPYAEHGIPEPGHFGSCSPETNCDMDCSHAFHGANAVYAAMGTLTALRKARGDK